MSKAVVFDSRTGNTELLAQWISQEIEDCVYCGDIENSAEASVYYVGFWTDKGSCSDKVKNFLENLHGKKIYLFGTAGFGASVEYFEKILNNVKAFVPDGNEVYSLFMCQGKMPAAVRDRYCKMLSDPEKKTQAQMLINNFDMALSHPDDDDRRQLIKKLKESEDR